MIKPVHKRKSKSDPKNYRPISVLNNLSLVFERVINPQVIHFISKFIPDYQFGFRISCGTQDYGAVLGLQLQTAIEQKQQVLAVALDVAGAFDKVWWKALISGLRHCGLKDRALKWFESYLSNRKLVVVTKGDKSNALTVGNCCLERESHSLVSIRK